MLSQNKQTNKQTNKHFQSIDKLTYREAMTDKTKGGYLLLKRFHDNGKISY